MRISGGEKQEQHQASDFSVNLEGQELTEFGVLERGDEEGRKGEELTEFAS